MKLFVLISLLFISLIYCTESFTRENFNQRTINNFCYASNITRERDCQKIQNEENGIWVSWNSKIKEGEEQSILNSMCLIDNIFSENDCKSLQSFLKYKNVVVSWSNIEKLCYLPNPTSETNCLDQTTPSHNIYTIWSDNNEGICDITSIINQQNCEGEKFQWFNIHKYWENSKFENECTSTTLRNNLNNEIPESYNVEIRTPLDPTLQEIFVRNDLNVVIGQLLTFTGTVITFPVNCTESIQLCLEIDESINIESPLYVQLDFGIVNITIFNIQPVELDAFQLENTTLVCANITESGFYYPILRINETLFEWRNVTIDACGVYLGDNTTCDDCEGTPVGDATVDVCGICNGNGTSCLDCLGVVNGTATFDLCGVCDGNDSTCTDCQLIPNGNSTFDECGVCNGDNSTCSDCAGIPNGLTCVDPCGVCNGTSDCRDCFGILFGTAVLDICNVCNGTNDTCADCLGTPGGNATLDVCDVCNGNGTSCLDCLGIPNGNTLFDECGVCGGNNLTCAGCDCIPNSGIIEDLCGVCNGDDSTCIGCDGFSSIPIVVRDVCGVCGGNDTTGITCNITVDPFCVNVSCSNNGVCEFGVGICQCFNGFLGEDCSDIDLCFDVSCGIHGECNVTTGNCDCAPNFFGTFCDTEVPDLCEDVDCGTFGSCNPGTGFCECTDDRIGCRCTELDCGINGFYSPVGDECVCLAGYAGDLCDECQLFSVGGKTFLCVPTDAFITNACLIAVPDEDVSGIIDFFGAFTLDETEINGLSCNCIPLTEITPITTGTADDQCERRVETINERAHVQIERINKLTCHCGTILNTGGVFNPDQGIDETGKCYQKHWIVIIVFAGLNIVVTLAIIIYLIYYNTTNGNYNILTAQISQPIASNAAASTSSFKQPRNNSKKPYKRTNQVRYVNPF